MANKLSAWLACRTMPSFIKTVSKSKEAINITDSKELARFIYHQYRSKFEPYGIKSEDVLKEVEKQWKVKKGWMAGYLLRNGRKSIQEAIKDGRIKFVDNDRIAYIDRKGEKFDYTFDEMAIRCYMNVAEQKVNVPTIGEMSVLAFYNITDKDFRKIIDDEYSKFKK